MTGAFIILSALVTVGLVLYLHHRFTAAPGDPATVGDPATDSPGDGTGQGCCGMHITCEKDSLLASVSPEIEYFDDEELDAFRGRGAAEYQPQEIEQFRDVLLTLLPDDIAPWARSIQLRGITLPEPVRDELLMLVAEARAARAS